ncbi:hypothetical protein TRFO_35381 [Tritrichomonas foetus]|uniref:DOCKER Lobe A domain-containing protein n=1 Tax=Tritrichomonas foetus TaxID=1144522 RepID=A0A1J4JGH3_9EUKA|nr:hypothetical protein TRFO_35381 [Tritrichomonas foetus]|eukprot:OHS98256.1 hypothetical protein TRFO_35381 [Tritrichomonas foetus]
MGCTIITAAEAILRYKHTKKPDPPSIIQCTNEYILSEEDKTTNVQKLEKSTIMQFLNRTSIDVENGSVFELKPISSIIAPTVPNQPFLTIPPPLSSLSVSCLHVVPSSISVHGSVIQLSDYRGCIFLYDQDKNSVASEAVYFVCTNGKFKYPQTNGNDIYFECQNCKPTLLLVMILMHSKTLPLDKFIERITSRGTPSDDIRSPAIPFAYSFVSPFQTGKTEFSFNFPWTIVRPPHRFENLVDLSGNDVESISLIGKVNIQIIPFESLPKVCLASDQDINYPLLALSIPQRTFFPTSIISVSMISFSFNKQPKGDYAIFKMYLSNDLTDPTKPDGIPVFVSRTDESVTNVYQSIAMPLHKHIVFPDIVRMKLDKPLKPTSNIIIQFLTIYKDSPSVYKLTAFPLFIDGNIITSTNHSYYTHHSKDLKNCPEYLSKCKQSRKSSVNLCIDIPQVFYPSPHLSQLATAMVPQQVQWNTFKQLQPEIILPQLIPIIAKLFTIISPLTAEYLLDIISMFEPDDSKPQIKSWLYHNFDPNAVKTRFLSSFTNSIENLIQNAIESNHINIIENLIKSFDIICDILITSYLLKMEDYFPKSLYSLFLRFSTVISIYAKRTDFSDVIEMNIHFGNLMFIFHSLTNEFIMDVFRIHIKNIIDSENPDALVLIWDFIMRFTDTNEFAIFLATHFPIKSISRVIFSPYSPVLSVIFLAMSKTFLSGNYSAIAGCCAFMSRLCLPLEDIPSQMRYRIAYAFYPLLDILSSNYEKLPFEHRLEVIPAILFMIGYSPQQLLRFHFIASSANIQNHFIKFFDSAVETCLEAIGPNSHTLSLYNGAFDQLTERILQFFNFNIKVLNESVQSAIEVLSKLTNSPYQIPNNFPRLFDTISRIILYYPGQRSLVSSLLAIVTSNQHLVRCFATSLILLFFKSDFDTRKNVVVSSVEVLDTLTNLMLHSPKIENIKMYKLMLTTVSEMSTIFKNDTFTQKLNERTTAANYIADIIEKLRIADHPPEEHCKFVMQIADQYKTYPSMRVNWLREIVQINLKRNSIASAFVAQLHICALIATVIQHESEHVETSEFNKQFNLLVCQPISTAKFVLSPRLFEFFPSVLVETKIDFRSLSEDFKFIASDFTINYLNDALTEAIKLGIQAKLFYSVRPLYSLQLRIMVDQGKYGAMGEICHFLGELFDSLKASETTTHNTPLSFYTVENKIYTVEEGREKEFEQSFALKPNFDKIYKYEDIVKDGSDLENPHCWDTFRKKPSIKEIEMVSNCNAEEIQLIQFKTKLPLPCYMLCSEIVQEMTVKITLLKHAQLETDKVNILCLQIVNEFERFFPCKNTRKLFGDFKIHFEHDISRLISAFNMIFFNEDCVGRILIILSNKGGKEQANELAFSMHPTLERLIRVFRKAIDSLNNKNDLNEYYESVKESLNKFQEDFSITKPFDTKPFEGKTDPLLEKFDWE